MELTNELIEKAKACKTTEELVALAKENGVALNINDAELHLQDYVEGEVADVELDKVAGGTGGFQRPFIRPIFWKTAEEVSYLFNLWETVLVFGNISCGQRKCIVINRKPIYVKHCGYTDSYFVRTLPGDEPYYDGWHLRTDMLK